MNVIPEEFEDTKGASFALNLISTFLLLANFMINNVSPILVIIGIDCIGSCKSNYHTIMDTSLHESRKLNLNLN
jgi:hypothetical protein